MAEPIAEEDKTKDDAVTLVTRKRGRPRKRKLNKVGQLNNDNDTAALEIKSERLTPMEMVANNTNDSAFDDIDKLPKRRVRRKKFRSKNHICSKCGSAHASPSALLIHMRKHTGERPYSCKHCPKQFSQQGALTAHLKVHSGEKPFTCSVCGRGFKQSGNLQVHMRIHTGERPYSCDVCGFAFAQKGDRDKHLTLHTNCKTFSCSECSMTFRDRSYLKRHLKMHAPVRDFPCQYCPKTFADKTSLKIHTRGHTGERPYACEQCPKSFATAQRLKNHTRIHTGEKPYVCEYCAYACSDKGNLGKHMKVHSLENRMNGRTSYQHRKKMNKAGINCRPSDSDDLPKHSLYLISTKGKSNENIISEGNSVEGSGHYIDTGVPKKSFPADLHIYDIKPRVTLQKGTAVELNKSEETDESTCSMETLTASISSAEMPATNCAVICSPQTFTIPSISQNNLTSSSLAPGQQTSNNSSTDNPQLMFSQVTEASVTISHEQALQAINTVFAWLQSQEEAEPSQFAGLLQIQELALSKCKLNFG